MTQNNELVIEFRKRGRIGISPWETLGDSPMLDIMRDLLSIPWVKQPLPINSTTGIVWEYRSRPGPTITIWDDDRAEWVDAAEWVTPTQLEAITILLDPDGIPDDEHRMTLSLGGHRFLFRRSRPSAK